MVTIKAPPRMVMAERRRCEVCAHWAELDTQDAVGECHRYPPTVAGGSSRDIDKRIARSVFPVTLQNTTCGEWKQSV